MRSMLHQGAVLTHRPRISLGCETKELLWSIHMLKQMTRTTKMKQTTCAHVTWRKKRLEICQEYQTQHIPVQCLVCLGMPQAQVYDHDRRLEKANNPWLVLLEQRPLDSLSGFKPPLSASKHPWHLRYPLQGKGLAILTSRQLPNHQHLHEQVLAMVCILSHDKQHPSVVGKSSNNKIVTIRIETRHQLCLEHLLEAARIQWMGIKSMHALPKGHHFHLSPPPPSSEVDHIALLTSMRKQEAVVYRMDLSVDSKFQLCLEFLLIYIQLMMLASLDLQTIHLMGCL